MRLDKYIANNSAYSRAIARRLIKQGRVSVNGLPASKGEQKISMGCDHVLLDDLDLKAIAPIYLMLNKPLDAVCANEDAESLTVMDLLCPENFLNTSTVNAIANTPSDAAWWYSWKELDLNLHTAGRLDKDSTGLVLISNDGAWTHRITSPRHACTKEYIVEVTESLTSQDEEAFAAGIQLKNEDAPCKPATMKIMEGKTARVTISEGKYHQVRRMFAAIGNHVTQLKRVAVGGLSLDPQLDAGQFRLLGTEEIAMFASGEHIPD